MSLIQKIQNFLTGDNNKDEPTLPNWANNPRKLRTENELSKLGIPINR